VIRDFLRLSRICTFLDWVTLSAPSVEIDQTLVNDRFRQRSRWSERPEWRRKLVAAFSGSAQASEFIARNSYSPSLFTT
jgi:hypothetical protein